MTTATIVFLVATNTIVISAFIVCLKRHIKKKKAEKNERYYKHLKEASTNHW